MTALNLLSSLPKTRPVDARRMTSNKRPFSPLLEAGELAGMLDDPDIRVCDIRWYLADPERGRAEYLDSHIPGAVFVDLDTHLSARKGPGRHPLPDPVRFSATLGRLGIRPHTTVVAYDSAGGAIAARMWWMLRQLGHPRVFVLDGGWSTWVANGHRVERGAVDPDPGPYPVLMRSWPGAVSLEEIRTGSHMVLVDARAEERYSGAVENVDARPGHIPGAVNLPHTGNLDDGGRHLPPALLAQRFAHVGRRPVVYCGSGVTACANILAMELAGVRKARLYPGSWSEWAAHPELPAEQG